MSWILLLKMMLAADTVGISAGLLYSVCHTETRIRNVISKHDGGSPSYGYCQVKLGTAKQFLPDMTAKKLMEPYYNFLAAATYLKHQATRFGSNRAISAYNAGRPIKGNKKYVKKVLTKLEEFHADLRINSGFYK
jgi:hypothetical protein